MVFRLFSFSACNSAKTEVSYDTTEGGIGLEKDSALYQLMDTRMHSVMNGIVSSDGEYQAILRKSDIYSGELDRMDLSKEIRLLIDRYVSEQNAHSTCAIDPGLGCSPTCWDFPTARPCF